MSSSLQDADEQSSSPITTIKILPPQSSKNSPEGGTASWRSTDREEQRCLSQALDGTKRDTEWLESSDEEERGREMRPEKSATLRYLDSIPRVIGSHCRAFSRGDVPSFFLLPYSDSTYTCYNACYFPQFPEMLSFFFSFLAFCDLR